jgi:DNA repair exonuclease SbcCD ATPase subunit
MIIFEKCRWKNILSTGNSFTEIDFTRSTNTLIIGANGAGKSTILDALTFGLFGKPFRKINKPQLVNTINNADAVVEIEFKIGRKQYKIIRGIKPNIFEIYCDNVLVNQDAKAKDYQEHLEKFILKLNYKSFTQVVVLGSAAFIPFMQLTPADRRAIIEDLLDIQIFSSMNSLVKDALSTIKENTTKYRYDITLTEEKIGYQKQNIEDHKKHNEDEIKKKQEELEVNGNQVKTLQKDVELIQKHIDVLQSKITDKLTVEGKNKKFFQLEAKVEANIKKNKKDMEFYEQNDNCPTCQQHIEETFRQTQVSERKTKVETQQKGLKEIESEIFKLNERLVTIEKITKHITAHNNEIVKHNSTISAVNKYITKLNKEITELSTRKDTLMEENDKLKTLNLELEALQKVQEELTIEKQYYDFAATLLKDSGIKTKIIKQYLPVMNKLINKYLTAMDFFVNFNLNESFEETIKSRHRDVFSYASFSEGEKMRIDLALLFTWRQIAKMKNSTNTNLLILDEVFDSSLDGVGTEEFMKLLNSLDNSTNVFVISHKGDQLFDKFRSVIKFEKKNNFSQVVK